MSKEQLNHQRAIHESWVRCKDFGLKPQSRPQIVQLNRGEREDAREGTRDLIVATEEQVLPYYENILVNSNSLVLLADQYGNLINSWGVHPLLRKWREAFLSRVRPGWNSITAQMLSGRHLQPEKP